MHGGAAFAVLMAHGLDILDLVRRASSDVERSSPFCEASRSNGGCGGVDGVGHVRIWRVFESYPAVGAAIRGRAPTDTPPPRRAASCNTEWAPPCVATRSPGTEAGRTRDQTTPLAEKPPSSVHMAGGSASLLDDELFGAPRPLTEIVISGRGMPRRLMCADPGHRVAHRASHGCCKLADPQGHTLRATG
jgi:hypothetical protein